jgi:hypothetical protein
MELTVKTLKGEKFSVTAEESNTIEEVKGLIVSTIYTKEADRISLFLLDRFIPGLT